VSLSLFGNDISNGWIDEEGINMNWKDAFKIPGAIITLLIGFYALNYYIENIVVRKLNDPDFVNKISEKFKRPIVIFDHNSSILIDNGAMKFIDNIKVVLNDQNKQPEKIIVSPNRHLNIAPLLESLDDDFVIESKRGNKFDWVYELSSIDHMVLESSAEPKELKRFRLEIIP